MGPVQVTFHAGSVSMAFRMPLAVLFLLAVQSAFKISSDALLPSESQPGVQRSPSPLNLTLRRSLSCLLYLLSSESLRTSAKDPWQTFGSWSTGWVLVGFDADQGTAVYVGTGDWQLRYMTGKSDLSPLRHYVVEGSFSSLQRP